MKPLQHDSGLLVTKGLLRTCLLAFAEFGSAAVNAQGPEEKLLMGFEEREVKSWTDVLKGVRTEAETKDGVPHVVLRTGPAGSPSAQEWKFFKGKASEGDYAMALQLLGSEPFGFKVPDEPSRLNALFRSAGNFFYALNTCGTFRRIMPMDWSGHDRLRLDVHCEDVAQTVRVQLEDEEIQPPIDRSFVVAPGKWTTLEIDLHEAAKVRRLDRKRMATLTVAVVKVEGKTPKYPCALLDNIRLSAAAAPAALPIVRDTESLELPAYYKMSSRSVVEQLPAGKPDRSPLPEQKPIVIPLDKALAVTPVGWAAAYDNRHLLVGVCDSTNAFALQSADGGQTWKGIDGAEKPTAVPMRIANYCIDHQAGRGDVVGQRGDVFVMSNMGCYGTVLSPPRYFTSKLTFTGKGWDLLKEPALVDSDMRHCTSNQTVIRTKDGRLWAAYGLVGRLGTNHINLRYSDDDGLTWKSSREGTNGVIPGSMVSETFGVGFSYSFDEPCLVPFGKGVACLWEEYPPNPARNRLRWTHFDGATWAPIADVPAPPRVPLVFGRPHIHAVSLGAKEIFIASGFRKGILHYKDGTWTHEAADVPFGARLSAVGDKTIVVVAVPNETPERCKGPAVIQAWQRDAIGQWTGPRELAREDHPLTGMGALNELRPGLQVQAYAPPNFVPIAWSCEKQKWVKFLRLPVGN